MDRSKFFYLEAEMEVLGALIKDNKVMKDIIDILNPEDFYKTAHGIIFAAMKKLYIEGKPIDAVTLHNELGSGISEVGGVTYIAQLIATSVSTCNVMAHCSIVKSKSRRRQLYTTLNQALHNIKESDVENDSVIESLQNDFRSIECFNAKRDADLQQGLENYLSLLELRHKSEGIIGGYATGFRLLDDFSGGFQKQDLVILAARPSMGKSAVALNIAANMALDNGLGAAVFQLEMNQNSIIERIVSNRASIPMNKLKKGELADEEWTGVMDITSRLASSGLNIYDDVYTLKDIRSECKRLKLQKGLDVVFIDYLQLIDNGSSKKTRNEDVSEISRGLKLLAKELDITVVALSQLSRGPEARNDHRPFLSDLRDSGSIEQDADIVMFLYRDSYYNREDKDSNAERIEIIIAKNRNGETGTIKARWQGMYQRVVA
jgi:replicative DNA helicase